MGTQPNPSHQIVFGPFEYESLSGDLRKYGNRVRLQGKPLQILGILLDQPGQVVSRDELQRHLWEGTTFVDFEQGLNTAVNKLRQALGDSADQPRYVETVPGRGYRFIAPVQHNSGKATLEIAPTPIRPERGRRKQAKWWMPWAAGLALAPVALCAYWLTVRAGPAEALKTTRFTVAPPAGFALEAGASRQSFALSADGSRLAFTAMDSSGAFSAFVRDFNSLDSRLIPESAGAHTLFWPADGRSLFLTVKGQLRRESLEGNAHLVLSESPSFLFAGAWLSPEKLLLSTNHGSFVVPSSGGTLQPTKFAYPWPQILPDGEHILYVEWNPQARLQRARLARLDEPGIVKDLVESDSRVVYAPSAVRRESGYLMYVRAGNLVARPFDPRTLSVTGEAMPVASRIYSFNPTGAADFSVSNNGSIAYFAYTSRSQLVWVDREGRQVGAIGPADVNVKAGRLSPDGQKLVTAIFDVERGAQDLWVFDVKTNTGRRLTLDPGLRDAPVWSPDSKTLAFLHAVGGRRPQIHFRGLGEKDVEEAMPSDSFQAPLDWSPDGRFIAFANTGIPRLASETQGDVWLIDRANGRKSAPLLNTPFHEANATFSPDGKWLAFTSNESGRPEVYIQAFQSLETPGMVGERYVVSRAGATALRWRRDGKELFYLGFDGRIQAVPVKLSTKPQFGDATPLFAISSEARAAIHSMEGFDVSADGRRFVIPVVSSAEAPSLVVVQNWEALLPRKL